MTNFSFWDFALWRGLSYLLLKGRGSKMCTSSCLFGWGHLLCPDDDLLKSPKITFLLFESVVLLKRFTKFSALPLFRLLLVYKYTAVRLNLVLSEVFSILRLIHLPGIRWVILQTLYLWEMRQTIPAYGSFNGAGESSMRHLFSYWRSSWVVLPFAYDVFPEKLQH